MNNLSDNIKPILALLIVGLAFLYFFAILAIERKVDPQVIIAIVAMSSAATGYYYGSTTSSSKKDETISTLSNKQSPTVGNSENTTVQINPKQDGKNKED